MAVDYMYEAILALTAGWEACMNKILCSTSVVKWPEPARPGCHGSCLPSSEIYTIMHRSVLYNPYGFSW